jgi:hypothetical protein
MSDPAAHWMRTMVVMVMMVVVMIVDRMVAMIMGLML